MVISSAGEKVGNFAFFAAQPFQNPTETWRETVTALSPAGLLLHCTITIVGTLKAQVKNFLVQRTI